MLPRPVPRQTLLLLLQSKFRLPPSRAATTSAHQNDKFGTPQVDNVVNPRNPRDNGFNRDREETKRHSAETAELWRKLSIYVAGPIILLGAVNAYMQWSEHWEHVRNTPPDEINVEYPYQNIRVKKYPWGDGDKTLFWNNKVNYHKSDV